MVFKEKNLLNKQGFTIVELLVVMAVLGTLMVLIIPVILNSTSSAKIRAFETKKKLIEDAAVLYAEDNYMIIVRNQGNICINHISSTDNIKCKIKIETLIGNYLKAESSDIGKRISNPIDNGKYFDEYCVDINVDVNTRKVRANYIEKKASTNCV